eukprot:gene9979-13424_t
MSKATLSETKKFSVFEHSTNKNVASKNEGGSYNSELERLKSAEKQMTEIETRISKLESTSSSNPNISNNNTATIEKALKSYQKQILEKLKPIRDLMAEEGGDISQVKQERDEAINENKQLKKDIERLNYRVKHLIKALNEEENKKK